MKLIKVIKMGIRLYPENIKEVSIEQYGEETVENSNRFEEWLKKFPEVNGHKKGY